VIGAGEIWQIASAWVDGIATVQDKNSRRPKTSGFQVDSAGIGVMLPGG
jgi:hypothetical protein